MSDPMYQPVNPMTAHENNEEYKKALHELQLNHDQKVLAVFNGPEGDMLLDMWDDYHVRQPVIVPGSQPGTNEMREGRNAFIRMIRMTVNRARGIK